MRPALAPILLLALLAACEDPASPSGTCLGPQLFAADTTVSGVAFTDDCTAPNGTFGDVYQFTVAAQSNILFTMTPSGYAGQLALFTGTFEGGFATPRMIFVEYGRGLITVKAFLPAGTYYVVAGSDEAAGGDYTLASAPTTTTPCTAENTNWYTVPGADITGLLTTTDCAGAPGAFQDLFRILMGAGEQIGVTVEMNKMGAVLFRRDGSASAANIDMFATVQPNVTAGKIFTAPDKDAFNVHVISDNLAGGTLLYTVHIR